MKSPLSQTCLALSAFIVLSESTQVSAFWIFGHSPLIRARVDPIVNPGAVSSHAHTFVGSSAISQNYDYPTQLAGNCTTAVVQEDQSSCQSNWQPSLYWYNKTDSTFQNIKMESVKTYYLQRGPDNEPLKAFPPGLRMLAGDMMRRTYNASSRADQAISYACLDYAGGHQGDPDWADSPGFFKHNCPSGLRAQVFFPACGDGRLDSPDHKSHLAYPIENYNSGRCPSTHPIHYISIFYEFIYTVQNYPFDTTPGAINWVLSTGDTLGYGLHADFVNGWPVDLLQAAIDDPTCGLSSGGVVSSCKTLAPLQNQAAASACQAQYPLPMEPMGDVTPLQALPGCNPLWTGTGPKPTCSAIASTPAVVSPQSIIPPSWGSIGCISEPASGRALSGPSYSLPNNTAAACIAFCNAAGFTLAGVEWGQECNCGVQLSNSAVNATLPWTKCSNVCSGNKYENCGGSRASTIYQNFASYVDPAVASRTTSNGWVAQGCAVEATNGRALTGYSFTSNAMNNELCTQTCASKGFSIAGTEYSSECYCGNSFSNGGGALATNQASCNMGCSNTTGNAVCGGPSRLTLYGAPAASSSSISATATVNAVDDAQSSAQSSVPVSSAVISPTSSSQTVTTTSSSSSVVPSVVSAPQALSNGWTYSFCAVEATNGQRALTGYSFTDSGMTNEMCAAACAQRGWAISGTQYYTECYCGSAFKNGGGSKASDPKSCNTPCGGAGQVTCGGPNRLSVYTGSPVALAPLSNGWTFSGCVTDSTSGRALTGYSFTSSNMSNELCSTTCASRGFTISGTEYSSECYCGNSFVNGGGLNSTLSSCNMACSNTASGTVCGAGGRLSVYVGASSVPKPVLPQGWSSYGCAVESTSGRALKSYSFTSSSMTIDLCTATCSSKGFPIAGLEYASECYCGNSFSGNGGALASDPSTCSMSCSGQLGSYCGGPSRLSVFRLTANSRRRLEANH